jgi:hypothetical protein
MCPILTGHYNAKEINNYRVSDNNGDKLLKLTKYYIVLKGLK